MSKKLTIEFVREQFKKDGYTLLTKIYINAHQKLNYTCPYNHKSSISWNGWQQGHRCNVCGPINSANRKKHTIEFIREQFKKEGYTLLSKKYRNGYQKLKYVCPRGHIGTIRWNNWKQNKRCQQCCFENKKGESNPNWNSNLTDEYRQGSRRIQGYSEWRFAVYNRDNFTCQICGDNKGGNLVSHYLESYNNNPKLRTVLNNGICLCENCHNAFHHQYGRGNNTRKQFIEFINNYNRQGKLANV